MGITVAKTRVACNTGTGNQDITTGDLGGLTPAAALFICVRATVDGTPAAHAVISYGAATGSSERWCIATSSEDDVGTTDTYRRATTDECVMILNPADGTIDGEADFVAFIANGVTINWGDAPAAAYLLTVVLYAGTDLTALADTFTLGNQDVEVDVNTVGFEPDLLVTGTHGHLFNDTSYTGGTYFSAGAVENDGASYPQSSYEWTSEDNVGTSAVGCRVNSNRGVGQYGVWRGEFNTFDANGFSCWARDGNSNDDVGFLALYFNGAVGFWVGQIDSPTGVGNTTWNDPGFTPQFVEIGLTQLTAVDSDITTSDAGSIGFSDFDVDDEYCNSIQDEDAQGTTDAQSLSDDRAINFPDDDGGVSWLADFVSFVTLGWVLSFTATEGTAVKWWAYAIEGESTPPTGSVAVHMAWRDAWKSQDD